jgi:hypothetical protein
MNSTVASAQAGKCVWTVSAVLKAVDVHAWLAHVHSRVCVGGRGALGGGLQSRSDVHALGLGVVGAYSESKAGGLLVVKAGLGGETGANGCGAEGVAGCCGGHAVAWLGGCDV